MKKSKSIRISSTTYIYLMKYIGFMQEMYGKRVTIDEALWELLTQKWKKK